MTESDLIAEAIHGDDSAQRALYEMHYAAAFRFAFLLLQDIHDAEEVVQDTFVYLLRNLQRYDPDKGAFWTWVRVILVSRCRNKRRRRQLSLVSLENLQGIKRDSSWIDNPEQTLELHSMQQTVWEALQLISLGAREAIILRFYEGLSYAEIAGMLGCSSEAARSRVAHGKLQLRRLLTEQGEERVMAPGVKRTVQAR